MARLTRALLALAFVAMAPAAWAQQAPPPAKIDPPGELDKLKESCGSFKTFAGCAQELVTGQPLHIAFGTIAPQNGVGFGLAYVGHKTTENWRNTWNADGVGSLNGSWRAGLYVKLVDANQGPITAHFGTSGPQKSNLTELPEHPVISLYAQAISLKQVNFFGVGSGTAVDDRTVFGFGETIVGASVVKPLAPRLHASVYAEVNGRFVSVRSRGGQDSPTLEDRFDQVTAPGLDAPGHYVQAGEGVRVRPVLASDVLRLNYDLSIRHFISTGDSAFSFHRLTVDLSHDVALYRKTTRQLLPRDANGPDECALTSEGNHPSCASTTRDLQGHVGFRALLNSSLTPDGHTVPFYFQPTVGGADINGTPTLAGYQDYRFRAPSVLLLRETLEHSIWGPIGFALLIDQARVGQSTRGLGSAPWVHSESAGLTLRVGGAPEVYVLYGKGGAEGHHISFTINASLLGGSARPSLY